MPHRRDSGCHGGADAAQRLMLAAEAVEREMFRFEIGVAGLSPISFCRTSIDRGDLSYMLIPDALRKAKASGKLVPATPVTDWEGEPRAVLLCEPIRKAIEAGRIDPDEKMRQRWAKVEAAFSHFIEGGWVDENLVKQLVPHKFEHWEFRCRRPRPSIRVFGRFAMPDVFAATHHRLRGDLGGMNSPEFEHEKLVCEDIWRSAGLGAPFTGAPLFAYESYITHNANRKPRI
jgi:hypothetical protein